MQTQPKLAGVVMIILESGMHFDFVKAKEVGSLACIVVATGNIQPLVAGTLWSVGYGFKVMPDGIIAGKRKGMDVEVDKRTLHVDTLFDAIHKVRRTLERPISASMRKHTKHHHGETKSFPKGCAARAAL